MVKKEMANAEIESKLKELKIELLKQTQKRKEIRKGIARLLTARKSNSTKLPKQKLGTKENKK